jgi:hypothetical protein
LFAFERWQLGWLDDGQIICQTAGEATSALSAVEQPGGPKAVIVPTGATSALVVESRRALGYDAAISKAGALVYRVDTSIASGAGPIQVLPERDDDLFYDQAPLAAGESFTLCNVTITVVEARDDGDTLRVTVDEQNPCAGGSVEAQSGSNPQIDPCADVPAPSQADVMVRFVNQSGSQVAVLWQDSSQSPAQLREYFRLADSNAFDQETFAGHTWVVQDQSGSSLLEYTAAAEQTQCVLIKQQ